MGPAPGNDQLEVDPERLVAWLREDAAPQVIDVREPYERDAGYIADTRHVELTQLPSAAASVRQELPVVFYCRTGSRSLMAAQAFRASGFQAYSLGGGLVRWTAEGRPLSPPDGYVADH